MSDQLQKAAIQLTANLIEELRSFHGLGIDQYVLRQQTFGASQKPLAVMSMYVKYIGIPSRRLLEQEGIIEDHLIMGYNWKKLHVPKLIAASRCGDEASLIAKAAELVPEMPWLRPAKGSRSTVASEAPEERVAVAEITCPAP